MRKRPNGPRSRWALAHSSVLSTPAITRRCRRLRFSPECNTRAAPTHSTNQEADHLPEELPGQGRLRCKVYTVPSSENCKCDEGCDVAAFTSLSSVYDQ